VVRRTLAAAAALLLAPSALASTPRVHARAYVIENGASGQVLASYHARERLPIASLTKLMTVLLTLEHTRPSAVVTVAPGAAAVGESSVQLRTGERLSVRDLLEAALIQSANDAADALAYFVGRGDEGRFVSLMNARARSLGLTDTHYVRPDGLDASGHVSSARDVTKLARIDMRSPLVRSIVRRRTAKIAGGRTLYTWNDLLGTFPGVIGVKTGHTAAAGWSEVAAAVKPGVTIYATILGSPDRATRNADLAALLRWGLSRYGPVRAVVRDHVYARAETEFGRGDLELVPERPLTPVVRLDRPLVTRIVAPGAVALPVRRDQRLGEIRVYQGARLLGIRPLVAARAVSRPGLAGRVGWYAGRTLHHVVGWFT
jgi:D-alanyl-D-alanine carboxypeptidase (penicillin-binding protein 5/6)